MNSLSYELAKELKDAGFPQSGSGDMVLSENYCEQCNDYHHAYAPTLSELIAACGNRVDLEVRPDRSRASQLVGIQVLTERAPTPEEAVANLWLALNAQKEEDT